ncbi:hypothetical protein OGM22_04410 [Dickeya fangzhongdai]|uniref:hypothetical protein n=1 Tax=Dickeya fangzhongdai TaxID=1778540 RepID=UPI0011AB807B|nr:hypothetical protein [Dickeya fangzhongdai]WOY01087.1 hypothetical protein OGM22_04410 [Dickeya fangzhongdai]
MTQITKYALNKICILPRGNSSGNMLPMAAIWHGTDGIRRYPALDGAASDKNRFSPRQTGSLINAFWQTLLRNKKAA